MNQIDKSKRKIEKITEKGESRRIGTDLIHGVVSREQRSRTEHFQSSCSFESSESCGGVLALKRREGEGEVEERGKGREGEGKRGG